jgi:hypothetical protein
LITGRRRSRGAGSRTEHPGLPRWRDGTATAQHGQRTTDTRNGQQKRTTRPGRLVGGSPPPLQPPGAKLHPLVQMD